MSGTKWLGGCLAFAAGLLTARMARADEDTIRLGRLVIDDATVQALDTRQSDDTVFVATRGGGARGGFAARGGYYGGYRGGSYAGYRGGYYGGYRGGYYGGYRGGYYGGYRGGYYGGYRGYYGGWGLGLGWGGYWPYYGGYGYYGGYPYYYNPYLYTPYYYYPTYSVNTVAVLPSASYAAPPYSQRLMPSINDSNILPPPTQINPDGSYNYDGGPAKPVPMPPQDAAPKTSTTERFVSLPEPSPKKYAYAAYGEKSGARPAVNEGKSIAGK